MRNKISYGTYKLLCNFKGWLARDSYEGYGMGELFIYQNKPIRGDGYWREGGNYSKVHEKELYEEFKDIKFDWIDWDNEPILISELLENYKGEDSNG